MSNVTAYEWLRNKGFSITDIDFVESVLTFTSTAKALNNKMVEINQTFQMSFPDKKAEIVPNLTFQQFDEILHNNGLFVDLNEMLIRYKVQGFCVNICNQLLENQMDQ
ncbi:hypothetical protein [Bacillus sp. 1P06AnD]|uniref:hypothetical protein n=1 Tax=Bacillus sp. 1P06AnD TaxID=3132208 RepID=UPI00399F7073